MSEDLEKELRSVLNIYRGQDIDINYYYGFRQLMEVAIKALSPGINDPGTAILSIQALGHLLSFRLHNYPVTHIKDEKGLIRIITKEKSFKEVFEDCIYPIWDHGKGDRLVVKELHHVLLQLNVIGQHPVVDNLLAHVQQAILKQDLNG